MAKTTLHTEGENSAQALIRAGHYDMSTAWSFSAEDGDALLGPNGDDWDKFGRWHLGEDPSEPKDTKAHWKYPFGKDGKVFRRAVAAIRSRASNNGDTTVFEAAGRLMTAMDEEEKKKESNVSLRQILASRFGHFANTPATVRAEDDDGGDDDEAKRAAAAKKAEDDEAKRVEDEEAEKARRTRRARKTRRAKNARDNRNDEDDDDDDDADDAGDDDDDDDDDADMKKAASAGHAAALDAAFRTGARAQRRRCTAILAHTAAAANPVLAMSLAFETSMTPAAAITVLEKTPVPARGGNSLHQRMATSPGAVRLPTGAPDGPRGQQAVAASWDFALKDLAPPR